MPPAHLDTTGAPHHDRPWTVVVAGGSGARFGAAKQYELLGRERVVDLAVAVAARVSAGVVVVVPASDVEQERAHAAAGVTVVAGGATRSASVRAGLAAVPVDAEVVCIHDAARPFAGDALFASVTAAVRDGADAAVPGVAVNDTIKRVGDGRVVVETPDRATLVSVQTPQAFRARVLRDAHASGGDATDDAALVELLGGRVVVVDGDERNRKITRVEDLEWARTTIVGAT